MLAKRVRKARLCAALGAVVMLMFFMTACLESMMMLSEAYYETAPLPDLNWIHGWIRTDASVCRNNKQLEERIGPDADIIVEYGFDELSVIKFKQKTASSATKEIMVEAFKMKSGLAAFGLYTYRLEGEERGWPGIKFDNWISPGHASLVKGEYLVNILATGCSEQEIGEFSAALEPKIPIVGNKRPKGMQWLPREGMVPGSRRFIKGPLMAKNESSLLEEAFWGFGPEGKVSIGGGAEAYSADYGSAPALSKLIVVKFKKAPASGIFDDMVLALFQRKLLDVRREGDSLQGKDQNGYWVLVKRWGDVAALIHGETDRGAAEARFDTVRALVKARER